LKLHKTRLQVGDGLSQAGDLLLVRGQVEVAKDAVGFAVEALPRDAAPVGVVGDVTALAEEDDRGTAKTRRRDYDAHGVSFCYAVGGSSASLQLLAPLSSTRIPSFCPRLRKSLETAIYVDDLQAAETFYGTVLGLRVMGKEPGRHVFVQVGEASVLLAFLAEATLGTAEGNTQADLVRCIVGNPFRPVAVDPAWLRPGVVELARTIYEDWACDRMPELADALEQAGCANADILAHCREPGPHVRGCWVVDLLLGKE
jgi:catechol 2,3-dioxygenase-like lactoylglutathione lyase family enzyme